MPAEPDALLPQIEGQVRAAVRDALHRSTRKPLQWGGLAGYQQLVAIEAVLRQAPQEPQTTSLRQLAGRVTRAVEICRPCAEDVATAHAWLRRIATTLGYASAVTAAATAQPPLPVRSSAQVRGEMEALLAAFPRQTRYPRAQGAFLSAWQRLWRTWGPELLPCYDIPALPPDNLQLEGLFGALRRHQRRITGVASTRPLRDLGQFQVLFAADSEADLLAQLRTVPDAQYKAHRRRLAEAEVGRQHRWRLHRDPAGTVAALLQTHAGRRGVLAAPVPPPTLEYTA